MDQDIRIQGVPSRGDPLRCAFVVDRPVYPGRSFYFGSPERAGGSPLAGRLFDIPGIASVLVSNDTVTVTVDGPVQWQEIGREIGSAIRETLRSGADPVSPELVGTLPPAGVIREVVTQLLDTRINPAVAGHGGYVELVDVQDNVVYLRMGGGCQGCGMADATLRAGVERMIREMVPEVGDIVDATDHASGRNPYFASTD